MHLRRNHQPERDCERTTVQKIGDFPLSPSCEGRASGDPSDLSERLPSDGGVYCNRSVCVCMTHISYVTLPTQFSAALPMQVKVCLSVFR